MNNSIRRFLLCNGQTVTFDELENDHQKLINTRSHIIGEMRRLRVFDQNKKVTALAVYERSVSVKDVPTTLPEIRMDIVGDALHIKCTQCLRRRRWKIGRAALLQLMDSLEGTITLGV